MSFYECYLIDVAVTYGISFDRAAHYIAEWSEDIMEWNLHEQIESILSE